MWLEISRGLLRQHNCSDNDVNEGILQGFYNVWNDKRIKNAFNGGNGTFKDFKRYMKDNQKYCVFVEVKDF